MVLGNLNSQSGQHLSDKTVNLLRSPRKCFKIFWRLPRERCSTTRPQKLQPSQVLESYRRMSRLDNRLECQLLSDTFQTNLQSVVSWKNVVIVDEINKQLLAAKQANSCDTFSYRPRFTKTSVLQRKNIYVLFLHFPELS